MFEVNFKVVNLEYRLKKGDVLNIYFEFYVMDDIEDVELDIIYEDDDIVIVNKFFNVIVYDDGVFEDYLIRCVNMYF